MMLKRLKLIVPVLILQIIGIAIAWEGNAHGPDLFRLLLLLPSSVALFVWDGPLGQGDYQLALVAVAVLNLLALSALSIWEERNSVRKGRDDN